MRRVLDINQVQTIGGRGFGASAAISSNEKFLNPFCRPAPLTYRQQRAGDIAYHMVEKCIGPDLEYHEIATPRDINELHIAHRRARLARSRAKSTEILLTQQYLRGLVHDAGIQGTTMPGDLPVQ